MIYLTREQAIKNFRKMWNWIANETEKRQKIVYREDYFKENKIIDLPMNLCYLCEKCYAVCSLCPVDWGKDIPNCGDYDSPYEAWCDACDAYDWEDAAELAREIANLPLKEGVK